MRLPHPPHPHCDLKFWSRILSIFTALEHNLSQHTLDFGSITLEQKVVFNNTRSGGSIPFCLNFVCSCRNAVPPDKGDGGESVSSSWCTGGGFRSEPKAAGAAAAAMREQRTGAAGPVLSLCTEPAAVPCRAVPGSCLLPQPGRCPDPSRTPRRGGGLRPERGSAAAGGRGCWCCRLPGAGAEASRAASAVARRRMARGAPGPVPSLSAELAASSPPRPILPSPLVFHLLPFLLLFFRFLPTLPTCLLFPPSGPLRNSPPLFHFFFPFPSYVPSPLGWHSTRWGWEFLCLQAWQSLWAHTTCPKDTNLCRQQVGCSPLRAQKTFLWTSERTGRGTGAASSAFLEVSEILQALMSIPHAHWSAGLGLLLPRDSS